MLHSTRPSRPRAPVVKISRPRPARLELAEIVGERGDVAYATELLDDVLKTERFDARSLRKKAKAMKHKIHIFVYTIGKEEIFIRLAQKYKTQVVVDEDRFRKL